METTKKMWWLKVIACFGQPGNISREHTPTPMFHLIAREAAI